MPSSSRSVYNHSRVLITSGPTAVAIDSTRIITNRSTGAMGRIIARLLSEAGARVTLLEGAVGACEPLKGVAIKKFFYYHELQSALEAECGKPYDCVIHAAAVSDFAPVRLFDKKISSARTLSLQLKPTAKLVDTIKTRLPQAILAAFKLADNIEQGTAAATRLMASSRADLVLINTLTPSYRACIMRADKTLTPLKSSRAAIAKVLLTEIGRIRK